MTTYNPKEYRLYIRLSSKKHILVEGSNDKKIIDRLWHDFADHTSQTEKLDEIIIDTAQNLIDFSSAIGSNRVKVETICTMIASKNYATRFVGFVDREWSHWSGAGIIDLPDYSPLHLIDSLGRLIYSRGHSIENYLFEFETWSQPLGLLSISPIANQALNQFKVVFHEALGQACVISLALADAQLLQRASDTINEELITLSANTLEFDFDKWTQKLIQERKIDLEQIKTLKTYYLNYNNLANKSSPEILRWLCHGHIGFDFLWATFLKCLKNFSRTSSQNDNATEINYINKLQRPLIFANHWISRAVQNQTEYPRAIFELIDCVPTPHAPL